jgi:hypothetical protein
MCKSGRSMRTRKSIMHILVQHVYAFFISIIFLNRLIVFLLKKSLIYTDQADSDILLNYLIDGNASFFFLWLCYY